MPTNTNVTKLNVVFHGAFAFHVLADGNGIDVLIPEVLQHTYYAGPWQTGELVELEKNKTYKLGLPPKRVPNHFDDSNNKETNVFLGVPSTTAESPIFATFQLRPSPDEIRTLQHITLEKQNFENAKKDLSVRKIPDKVLGLVHVLTYDLSGTVPTIEGIHSPAAGKDPSIVNLHVFADPPLQTGNKLTSGTFSDMMSFTPKSEHPLKFVFPPEEIALVAPSEDVPGLRKIELVSLASSNLLTDAQLKQDKVAVAMMKAGAPLRPNFIGCVAGHICASFVMGPH